MQDWKGTLLGDPVFQGVRSALGALREKTHAAAGEESDGIIGFLHVIELAVSKNRAEIAATDESAAAAHESVSETHNEEGTGCQVQDQGCRSSRRVGHEGP